MVKEEKIHNMIESIKTGKIILFMGAGFSIESKNLKGNKFPLAYQFAETLGNLGDFDSESDLEYAAEKFINKKGSDALIKVLKETFTVKDSGEAARKIVSIPFRRIYTTNYDNIIEHAALEIGKDVEAIDINSDPQTYYKKYNSICVHINGSITRLSVQDLQGTLKLTEDSYLSNNDSFTSSKWWLPFKKDIEASSAIIFVGYSLNYDIDIKKILFENNNIFKEKTYFITEKDISERSKFKLEKFGTVLNIEVKGFADLVSTLDLDSIANTQETMFKVFNEDYLSEITDLHISDDERKNLLTRGIVNDNYIEFSLNNNDFYTIYRKKIDFFIAKIKQGEKTISLTSELGNGKTIFLKELSKKLIIEGYSVFWLDDYYLNFIEDIEKISKIPKSVIIIDKYSEALKIIEECQLKAYENISLVVADRSSNHSKSIRALSKIGFNPLEINIDILTEEEIEDFINLLKFIGYWGDKPKSIFETRYHNQLSFMLLDIFESEQIKQAISSLINVLINNDENKKSTVFAILLLTLSDLSPEKSYISTVAENDMIYDSSFIRMSELNELFKIENDQITTKSSVLSKFIIKNFFTPSYIIDSLLLIAKIADKYKYTDRYFWKLQTELFRFHFVEQLFKENHRIANLSRYYDNIKSALPWLMYEPHYWLQYAMSDIANKKYLEAQRKIDRAFEWAAKKETYDDSAIQNQQARLYLLQSMDRSIRGDEAFRFFKDANNILSFASFDKYEAKQISLYRKVYELKYSYFPKTNKEEFIDICLSKYRKIDSMKEEYRDLYISNPEFNKCEQNLEFILKEEGKIL